MKKRKMNYDDVDDEWKMRQDDRIGNYCYRHDDGDDYGCNHYRNYPRGLANAEKRRKYCSYLARE